MSKALSQHLQDGRVAPIYLIQSEEELLAMEARDALLAFLKTQDYQERKLYTQTDLNWHDLIAEMSTPSFFSEKCIYDIRLPEAKLGREGASLLGKVLPLAHVDQPIIFSLPLDWKIQKLAWFTQLQAQAVNIELKAPTSQTWKNWLTERLRQHALTLTPEALQQLSEWVDGNLLAADQEIRKLAFLFAGNSATPLDVTTLRQTMVNVAHYGAMDFREAFLALDWPRALRVLDRLEGEGESPILISRLLRDDLQKAMRLYGHFRSGKNEREAQRLERVFFDRATALTQFAKRLDASKLYQLLLGCEIMDLACKNAFDESPWMLFRRIVSFACAPKVSFTLDWSSMMR